MTDETKTELRDVITYPREAIVEAAHVAAAMGIAESAVAKLDLPCFYVGRRPRFLWGAVLDTLAQRSNPDAKPRRSA